MERFSHLPIPREDFTSLLPRALHDFGIAFFYLKGNVFPIYSNLGKALLFNEKIVCFF